MPKFVIEIMSARFPGISFSRDSTQNQRLFRLVFKSKGSILASHCFQSKIQTVYVRFSLWNINVWVCLKLENDLLEEIYFEFSA